MPKTPMKTTVITQVRAKGIFRLLNSHTATKAGTIANSPWAKLTTLTALKIRTNPRATKAYIEPMARPAATI